MIEEELPRARLFLLTALQKGPMNMLDILELSDEMARERISTDTLRYAIWDLVDRGEVEFTRDRRLQIHAIDTEIVTENKHV